MMTARTVRPLDDAKVITLARFIGRDEALSMASGDRSPFCRCVRRVFMRPAVRRKEAYLITWPDGVFVFRVEPVPCGTRSFFCLDSQDLVTHYRTAFQKLKERGWFDRGVAV